MKNKKTSKKIKNSFITQDRSIQSMIAQNRERVQWGLMSSKEEEDYINSQFSNRTDYAKNMDIRIPQGYHAQVKKTWEMYSMDRLFKYLVDRASQFGSNGFEWEIPTNEPVWDLKDKESKNILKKVDSEKKVWDKWASSINGRVANIIPGIDEINKWLFKHLLLGGMCPLEWEWGPVKVDGVTYQFPLKMTTYNTLSVVLMREGGNFDDEEIWVKVGLKNVKKEEVGTANQVSSYSNPRKGDPNWHEISVMGRSRGRYKKQEGFALKYNWSPGDNTALFSGKTPVVGSGLYPNVPFVGLFEILMLRKALVAADLAILDGVINYIVDWEIGDNTIVDGVMPNQPRPEKKNSAGTVIEKSTIQLVKEMITEDTRANVMQLFHPYYIKLKIITPDVASLISSEKYIQSIVELFLAFGILMSPSDRRIDFTDINVANFEQMIDDLRISHVKRFWEALCTEIVRRNEGKIKYIPNMVFNPLSTQSTRFRNELISLAEFGKLSSESLLQAFRKDKNVELARILKEINSGEKEIMDRNVPVSYKQQAVNSKGEETTSERPATAKGGRPKEKINDDKNKAKDDLETLINIKRLEIMEKYSNDIKDKRKKK